MTVRGSCRIDVLVTRPYCASRSTCAERTYRAICADATSPPSATMRRMGHSVGGLRADMTEAWRLRAYALCIAMAVAYGIAIAIVVLRPETDFHLANNFVPFYTIWSYLKLPIDWSLFARQVGGNLVLFSPLGFLLGLAGARRARVGALVVFPVAIELLQGTLVRGRIADVDDVLLNCLGGWCGWYLGQLMIAAYSALSGRMRRFPRRRVRRGG